MTASLKVGNRKHFRSRNILICTFLSAFAQISLHIISYVGVATCAFSLTAFHHGSPFVGLVLLSLGLCMAVAGFRTEYYFRPFFIGNRWARYVAGKIDVAQDTNEEVWIGQLSVTPRLNRGLLGVLEDADDVGYIRVSEHAIRFTGDHITLNLPFAMVKDIRLITSGLRGAKLLGGRIQITTDAFDGITHLLMGESESNTVPTARRTIRALFESLKSKQVVPVIYH